MELKKAWKKFNRNKVGYLMLAPVVIGILVFCYYPFIDGIVMSFYEKRSNTAGIFVGFRNYTELFKDTIFLGSIPTMLKIMLPKLLIQVVVPFIMAQMIFSLRSQGLQKVYRVLILVPIVAPGVVTLLIWRNIFNASSTGILNEIVMGLGLFKQPVDWLGSYEWVIFSVIFMGFPWVGGTSVLIYMSGLMSISTEMIESSRLDGAGTLRRIFAIDIPLLAGQIKYFFIFGIIGAFQDYSVQIMLTFGGPGDATYVPGYYLFRLIQDDELGYASAIGVLIFAVSGALLLLIGKLVNTDKIFD